MGTHARSVYSKAKTMPYSYIINSVEKIRGGEQVTEKNGSQYKFIIKSSSLYSECIASKEMYIGRKQLVLPIECRKIVLHTAHENPVAGHFSHKKPFAKIATHFLARGG